MSVVSYSRWLAAIAVVGLAVGCGPKAPPEPVAEIASNRANVGVLDLGGYAFELPEWWNRVEVTPPAWTTDDAVREYVTERYGADTGTPTTWREVLKVWALAYEKSGRLPVYIGHAYTAGEQFGEAAEVYAGLYELAGGQGENAEWYDCYLAYNAGQAYASAGDAKAAIAWYERAAAHAKSTDSAVAYYAEEANRRIAGLR